MDVRDFTGLIVTRQDGERLIIRDSSGATLGIVTVLKSWRGRARIQVHAPRSTRVWREEIDPGVPA